MSQCLVFCSPASSATTNTSTLACVPWCHVYSYNNNNNNNNPSSTTPQRAFFSFPAFFPLAPGWIRAIISSLVIR